MAHWRRLHKKKKKKFDYIKTSPYKRSKICISINYTVQKLCCPLILYEFPEHKNSFPYCRGLQLWESVRLYDNTSLACLTCYVQYQISGKYVNANPSYIVRACVCVCVCVCVKYDKRIFVRTEGNKKAMKVLVGNTCIASLILNHVTGWK